jgi:hypothetical protein
MLGEAQEKKIHNKLLKNQKKLSLKMYKNLGHIKLINQKKEVFLLILIAIINFFALMLFQHGKKVVFSQIINLRIKNHVGTVIKFTKLILKHKNLF